MESKIIKQEKNFFLEREEITLEIKNNITPTYDEVKAEIGKPAELIVIKKINANFGKQVFTVEVVVYNNAEVKEKIETIPKKIKKKMESDKKAEVKAKKKADEETKKAEDEAKEEKPTEEKVEEVKPEEKIEND